MWRRYKNTKASSFVNEKREKNVNNKKTLSNFD